MKPINSTPFKQLIRRNAFSLVEVVLALGITTLTLVSVLGLMTQGLKSGRESEDETMAASFCQEIIRRLQTKPYDVALNDDATLEDNFPLPALGGISSNTHFLNAVNVLTTDPGKAVKQVRIDVNPVLPMPSASPVTPPGQDVLAQVTITVSWPVLAPANEQQSVSFHTELYSQAQ